MHYNKKRLFFALLGLFNIAFSIQAQSNQILSPNIRSSIEQEQQKRLKEIKRSQQELEALQPTEILPEAKLPDDAQCFDIQDVVFTGNDTFNQNELIEVINFKPKCLGLSNVNEYLRLITNYYIEAGYVTSRAFLVPQDLSTKTLTIVILEGKVEKLLLNGTSESYLNIAFPHIIDTVLNLREIEQGLDQINRLGRYNARVKLLPGDKEGYSIVDIQTNVGDFYNAGVGYNNSGYPSTGEEQYSLFFSVENVLGLLDQWSLSASQNANNDKGESQSLSAGIDVPWGFWTLNYRFSYSDYDSDIVSNGFTFDSSGRSLNHDLSIKRLVYRDASSKLAFSSGLNHRRDSNYLLGTRIESTSNTLSSVFLSLDYSTRLGTGFFTVSPQFTMGTDWFGGLSDSERETQPYPEAQFYKGTFVASYTYPVFQDLNVSSVVFSQWSNDQLFGSQRVSIGSESSIRGFKNSSISGDEGYYWRNDLTWYLGRLPWVGYISGQMALDTGTIIKDSSDAYEGGSLLGSAVSVSTQSTYLSSSFSVGFPIESPAWLNPDDYVIYYRVDLTI